MEAALKQPTPNLSLARSMAADLSWANTEDRSARTAPARAALEAKFLAEAGGDPKRAESRRKAHYKAMVLKSLAVRAAKKAAREPATQNNGAA
jgi:hypothetical protein